jgi:hypothetical protein
MPYVLTFSIMVLAAVLFWGRFTIRRQNSGRRDMGWCAETAGSLIEDRFFDFDLRTVQRRAPIFNSRTFQPGMEYFFNSKLGLLAIVPHQELPSAVELRIGGKTCASFISAELAAQAVASGSTNHQELDMLSAADRPAKLGDWDQSHPHHFRT